MKHNRYVAAHSRGAQEPTGSPIGKVRATPGHAVSASLNREANPYEPSGSLTKAETETVTEADRYHHRLYEMIPIGAPAEDAQP